MPDTLTTELEAINTLLGTLGEAPINTLLGTLPADVSLAKDVLEEIRRKVCSDGWWFNKDFQVQSTLNLAGEIILATNVLAAELTYPQYGIMLVQRGLKLWNAFKQTYVFDQAPKLDITYLLDWAELPEVARQYIMLRAARVFQARALHSLEIEQSASREEIAALAEMKHSDAKLMNRNIFNGNGLSRIHRYRRR
ncbi:MAG: hypothetical protein ACRCZI_05325 [Cetobacterium sp.]